MPNKKLNITLIMTLGISFLCSLLFILKQNSLNKSFLFIQLSTLLLYSCIEELIFRGLILREFLERKVTLKKSILISSMVFSVCHLMNFEFNCLDFTSLLPVSIKIGSMMILGVFLTYIYLQTGKISICFLTHADLNSILLFSKIQSEIIYIYFITILILSLILLHNYVLQKKEMLC